MTEQIEINPAFEQAVRFVNETNRLIFLTGKAGTGKTTLLKHIRRTTFKQIAVVAPTGIAAINAEGSTIHSFFQFPFTPFVPVVNAQGEMDVHASQLPDAKFTSKRLGVIRNLELLVIDEISMVRADLLDQIDLCLRRVRRKTHLPFGGVQVVLIGDLYQLPPVARQEDWRLLSEFYPTPFFFDSFVVRNNTPVFIELDKVYRQNEERFLDLLNKVRNNELDEEAYELLNSRFKEGLRTIDYEDKVTLTTHNQKADAINDRNLNALPGRRSEFACKIEGNFPDTALPAEENLVIKIGARVMFLKNNYEKNYFNGKTGIVTDIEDDKIFVQCEEDDRPIKVERETWQNISYTLDRATKRVQEDVQGEFIQFPLRLAWAITIHKSQGLTFDKLIIDAADSFSAGQVYVALSRCRTLEGLTLSSRIPVRALRNDQSVLGFSGTKKSRKELDSIFSQSKKHYEQLMVMGIFDLSDLVQARKDLATAMQSFSYRITEGKDSAGTMFTAIDQLEDVAAKFRNQLTHLMLEESDTDSDARLQERLKKAAGYFQPLLSDLADSVKNTELRTESKEAAEELNPVLQTIFEQSFRLGWMMQGISKDGFSLEEQVKKRMKIRFPEVRMNVLSGAKNAKVPGVAEHPALYRKLLLLRDEICNEEHQPIYMVANAQTLLALCNHLPSDENELTMIPGFGPAKVNAFGDRFLSIIKPYAKEHNLKGKMQDLVSKKKKKKGKKTERVEEEAIDDEAPKKIVKGKSSRESLEMYKQGMTLDEIAVKRGYAVSTVEGHIAQFVGSGEIDIDNLMSAEKREKILKAFEKLNAETNLAALKTKLPDDISWADIRYVMAYRKSKQQEA